MIEVELEFEFECWNWIGNRVLKGELKQNFDSVDAMTGVNFVELAMALAKRKALSFNTLPQRFTSPIFITISETRLPTFFERASEAERRRIQSRECCGND